MFKEYFEKVLIKYYSKELGEKVLANFIEERKNHIRKYSSPHHTMSDDGTGITNFAAKDLFKRKSKEIYTEAVKRYNDPCVFIVKAPILGSKECSDEYWSLHHLDLPGKNKDLSDFWRIYEDVCKEYDMDNK